MKRKTTHLIVQVALLGALLGAGAALYRILLGRLPGPLYLSSYLLFASLSLVLWRHLYAANKPLWQGACFVTVPGAAWVATCLLGQSTVKELAHPAVYVLIPLGVALAVAEAPLLRFMEFVLPERSHRQEQEQETHLHTLRTRLEAVLIFVAFLPVLFAFIEGQSYYKEGTYLVGQNCLVITGQPSEGAMAAYRTVHRINVDADGTPVLISPCQKRTKVKLAHFEQLPNGEWMERDTLYEQKNMPTDEAILVTIRANNRHIQIFGQKVNRFYAFYPADNVNSGTEYLTFY